MIPFFSIIIPCYNQAQYLPDCINSIIKQDYQHWEAIVVNDGSTDHTSAVVKDYSSRDNRIKLLEKVNGGLSSARNYGLKASTGKRIIFLDSDDYLYNRCLSEIFECDKANSDDVAIRYGYTYVDEKGLRELHTFSTLSWGSLLPKIFYSNLGPPNSMCISKKTTQNIGAFDESLKSVEDWDYWIRVAKSGVELHEIQKPLVYYRYLKNSMSRNAFVMYDALKKVMQRAVNLDTRITNNSDLNKNYDIDNSIQLQFSLIRSLGVSIMQGKIDESIQLFKSETIVPADQLNPKDFESMCSYLTFRYWYTPDDIRDVFENYYPNFKFFFEKVGYSKEFIHKALYHIFKFHLFHKNIFRYGKPMATFINYYFKKLEKISL